jgi:hypothetical protein
VDAGHAKSRTGGGVGLGPTGFAEKPTEWRWDSQALKSCSFLPGSLGSVLGGRQSADILAMHVEV